MAKSRKWRNLIKKIIEREERAEQELNENLKHQFPTNTKERLFLLVGFLYGGEFEKVFAELQKGESRNGK